MLTLSLLRHAKSSWADEDLDDHDRPLSKRGTKAAPLVGAYMAANLPPVNCVLCSDAVRTRATLTLVLSELAPPTPEIAYLEQLYLAAPETYIEHIRACPDTAKHVLVIGHNPGMHILALSLVRSGKKRDLAALGGKFPTAALAVVTFEQAAWRDIDTASGKLERYVTPKQLA